MGLRAYLKSKRTQKFSKLFIFPGNSPRTSYMVWFKFFTGKSYRLSSEAVCAINVDLDTNEFEYNCNIRGEHYVFEGIPKKDLQNFVIVDDGVSNEFDPDTEFLLNNTREAKKILGEPLYNTKEQDSLMKVYTFYNERRKVSNEYHCISYSYTNVDSTPCSRVGHSFVISPNERCGYLFGGFTKLRIKLSEGLSQGKTIYYPVDDCWKFDLITRTWHKILSYSKPIPKSITPKTKLPNYFFSNKSFYDRATKLIVVYGYSMKFDVNNCEKLISNPIAFTIDPKLRKLHVIGRPNIKFLRLFPDVYISSELSKIQVLYSPKKFKKRSYPF